MITNRSPVWATEASMRCISTSAWADDRQVEAEELVLRIHGHRGRGAEAEEVDLPGLDHHVHGAAALLQGRQRWQALSSEAMALAKIFWV